MLAARRSQRRLADKRTNRIATNSQLLLRRKHSEQGLHILSTFLVRRTQRHRQKRAQVYTRTHTHTRACARKDREKGGGGERKRVRQTGSQLSDVSVSGLCTHSIYINENSQELGRTSNCARKAYTSTRVACTCRRVRCVRGYSLTKPFEPSLACEGATGSPFSSLKRAKTSDGE